MFFVCNESCSALSKMCFSSRRLHMQEAINDMMILTIIMIKVMMMPTKKKEDKEGEGKI